MTTENGERPERPKQQEDAARRNRFPLKSTNEATDAPSKQDVGAGAPEPRSQPRFQPAAEQRERAKDNEDQTESGAETSEVDESTLKSLLIEPPVAEVKAGETVGFQVKAQTNEDALVKVANAEWTAQGGEIDEKGVYAAGTAAGKYAVIARAGALSATAQVTIAIPKPRWKVLDPEDQNDPVEHEVHEIWMRDKEWRIIAASVRGKLHAHKALWRDDSYAADAVDDWTVIAVSDGAGSASLSRIGSTIACDGSVQILKDCLSGMKLEKSRDDNPTRSDLNRIKAYLVLAACEARDGILREADTRKCAPGDLSATLLVAVVAPWKKAHLIGTIQVGDGSIAVYTKSGDCTVMGDPDYGEYAGETIFVNSPMNKKPLLQKPFDHRVRFTLKTDVQCIGVMCDGVADDFFPEDKRLVQLFNGDPIEGLQTVDGDPVRGVMHSVIPNPRDGEALQDWLKYEKKGSSDDRTLVLLYRS
ncbi:MAG: PP2C family serine/threonine-protein phosphatase [Planctomycetota bacterium]